MLRRWDFLSIRVLRGGTSCCRPSEPRLYWPHPAQSAGAGAGRPGDGRHCGAEPGGRSRAGPARGRSRSQQLQPLVRQSPAGGRDFRFEERGGASGGRGRMWVFWVKDQGGGISWFPHLGIGGSETSCFAIQDFLVLLLWGGTSCVGVYEARLPVSVSTGQDFLF